MSLWLVEVADEQLLRMRFMERHLRKRVRKFQRRAKPLIGRLRRAQQMLEQRP